LIPSGTSSTGQGNIIATDLLKTDGTVAAAIAPMITGGIIVSIQAPRFAQNLIFCSHKNNPGQGKKRTFVAPTLLARSRTHSSICTAETRRKTKMAARDIVAGSEIGGPRGGGGGGLVGSGWFCACLLCVATGAFGCMHLPLITLGRCMPELFGFVDNCSDQVQIERFSGLADAGLTP